MTASTHYEIRVRGIVQGVGFRPSVWKLASEAGLRGDVRNDAAGVRIRVVGTRAEVDDFVRRLRDEAPPLSRIEDIAVRPSTDRFDDRGFRIGPSAAGKTRTQVAPDAAICDACRWEVRNPDERRFRYPFTNCTHCGPRLSIVRRVPYDRKNTSMSCFELCADCAAEYSSPTDRRFHAQPIACPACGPRVWLEPLSARMPSRGLPSDPLVAATALLEQGAILAVRGLGGFHLACDATNEAAVHRLRLRKQRDAKPFALMAIDVAMVRRLCFVSDAEAALLKSPEAPIVLLESRRRLPEAISPGLSLLGFMLPYTPLHLLLLQDLQRPVVMTSANLSDAPQIISNEEALGKLQAIADFGLFHDREIVNRVDDSVTQVVDDRPRVLRRARGYAPSPLPLPGGFGGAPDLLAFGADLKSTFCLLKDGEAILSQHQGDLEDLETFDAYERSLQLFEALYEHRPSALVADKHPQYVSRRVAAERASVDGLPLITVQHHHAHVAACLVENHVSLDSPPVLGVALDGNGYGDDGTLWGGEIMLADYRGYRRLATFRPVPLIGGTRAIREPWRSLYAHLLTSIGSARLRGDFGSLELVAWLSGKPTKTLDRMVAAGLNSPLSSSCGRLFDAVGAALGLCRERASFEAQGAMMLEALVDQRALLVARGSAYRFALRSLPGSSLRCIDPQPMWEGLLDDLMNHEPGPLIAARFHLGLSQGLAECVSELSTSAAQTDRRVTRVALSGGCFQNARLVEALSAELRDRGFEALTHARVPTNDGGLALGQVAVAAALRLPPRRRR